MKAGDFPRRLLLGSRAVGWKAEDIEEWLTNLSYVPRPEESADHELDDH
jgi:predicted DNA-binding transcriptional regulator AlpA